MSSVNAKPEDLRKVANAIKTADAEIKAAVQKMQSSLNSAQWNDPVRKKFEQDFNGLLSSLRSFQSSAPGTVQYLNKKASELEQFLKN